LKALHFSSEADIIAAAENWSEEKRSELFLSGLQKLEQGAKKHIKLRGQYVH